MKLILACCLMLASLSHGKIYCLSSYILHIWFISFFPLLSDSIAQSLSHWAADIVPTQSSGKTKSNLCAHYNTDCDTSIPYPIVKKSLKSYLYQTKVLSAIPQMHIAHPFGEMIESFSFFSVKWFHFNIAFLKLHSMVPNKCKVGTITDLSVLLFYTLFMKRKL